ncbi:MAG: hypothetical protein ACYC1Z_14175, partial [Georgenia sp.]
RTTISPGRSGSPQGFVPRVIRLQQAVCDDAVGDLGPDPPTADHEDVPDATRVEPAAGSTLVPSRSILTTGTPRPGSTVNAAQVSAVSR